MPEDTLELAARLEAKTPALSRRCIDAMYADRYWQVRFGDRGRAHAERDSAYHVQYVVSALRARDPGLFANYARWVRGVLTARNMCTWHLCESFRQLRLAMGAEAIPAAGPAHAIMEEGARALHYTAGAAGALQAQADEIEASVRRTLSGDEVRLPELLSFVLDGLAREDAQTLPAHIAFLEAQLLPAEQQAALKKTLRALRQACVGVNALAAVRLLDAALA